MTDYRSKNVCYIKTIDRVIVFSSLRKFLPTSIIVLSKGIFMRFFYAVFSCDIGRNDSEYFTVDLCMSVKDC